jgi:signal transduction histidine kinase
VWNEQAATINIFIAPPYWRTWWFQSLLLLIAAGAIYAAYRYRIGHIIKLERMRGRIATDLHDDIGTSLTRIALFSDVVKRELDRSKGGTAKARSLAAEIGDTARGVIDSMNDIVWTVDPRNDAFDHVTLRMKNYATKILSIKGIDHVITVDPTLEDIKLPIDFRRNIFLIFKESLNNIIKHAEASRVEITLRRNNGALQMTMRDNGKGISRSGAGTGHGLKNLNDRAGLMKGTCSVEPSSPHGTVITLNVDIP